MEVKEQLKIIDGVLDYLFVVEDMINKNHKNTLGVVSLIEGVIKDFSSQFDSKMKDDDVEYNQFFIEEVDFALDSVSFLESSIKEKDGCDVVNMWLVQLRGHLLSFRDAVTVKKDVSDVDEFYIPFNKTPMSKLNENLKKLDLTEEDIIEDLANKHFNYANYIELSTSNKKTIRDLHGR